MDGDDGAVASLSIGMQNLQKDWVYTASSVLIDTVETNKGSSKLADFDKGKGKGKINVKGKINILGKDKGKAKGKGLAIAPEGGTPSAHEKKKDRTHLLRSCRLCCQEFEWRRMEATFMTHCDDKDTESRMGTSAEKDDLKKMKQYGDYTYVCVMCVALRDEITMPEAARAIKQPRTQKGMDRCKKFEFAKLQVQATFTFLYVDLGDDVASTYCPDDDDSWLAEASSVSDTASACGSSSSAPESHSTGGPQAMSNKKMKKEIRNRAVLKAATMTSFFAPMANILFLKNTDMEAAMKAAHKLQKWIDDGGSLKEDGIQEEDDEDARIGDELEIDFEETLYKQRAFADHETPHLMRNAADYSDRWFKNGKMEFRVYYVCIAGGSIYPCNTVIEATAWDRLIDQLEATGQRWYCKMCHAKYKTKYGVLVEFINGSQACYCRGELPPFDIQDAKFMAIEQHFGQYKTPAELLAALPTIHPLARGDFLKPTAYDGHYIFNAEMMAGLETMDWSQMYNMTGTQKPVKK